MSYLNKQTLQLYGISEDDYLSWCEKTRKAAYKQSTKKEFFERLSDGRLVKDTNSGKLVNKRPRRR